VLRGLDGGAGLAAPPVAQQPVAPVEPVQPAGPPTGPTYSEMLAKQKAERELAERERAEREQAGPAGDQDGDAPRG
jgi:hypothetical protein